MIEIYAFGSNGSGQLAVGNTDDLSSPKKAFFVDTFPREPISQLRAGGNHTLLLTGGKLYYSGDFYNDLTSSVEESNKFKKIELLNTSTFYDCPIICCAASWEATIFVVQDKIGRSNKLHTFGNGPRGELGHGESVLKLTEARLLKEFPPPELEIKDLAASVSHVVAVLSNGDVYGWGNGRKGQIGEPKQFIYHPRRIVGLDFKIIRAACGREFTCLFGEPQSGRFIVLGSDKWNIITSAPSEIFNWKDIGAGWGSIHVLKDNGELISWGRDDHGQLAPPGLPQLSKIAVGSEHILGLTKDNDILAWGWGEHGNCGPLISDGDLKGRWNTIDTSNLLSLGGNLTGIGAGCATSWIYTEYPKS